MLPILINITYILPFIGYISITWIDQLSFTDLCMTVANVLEYILKYTKKIHPVKFIRIYLVFSVNVRARKTHMLIFIYKKEYRGYIVR